jgi:GPH family glycoside/pentoside/hexuronide:cation symporter
VEWDELQTGQRHEGMFYSLVQTLRKVGSSLSLPFVLMMLEWTGYVANAPTQPPNTIPAVFLLLGIFLAARYPLDRKRFAELRTELARRHAEKAEA